MISLRLHKMGVGGLLKHRRIRRHRSNRDAAKMQFLLPD